MTFINGIPSKIFVDSSNCLVIEQWNTEPENEMDDSEYHVVRLSKEEFVCLVEMADSILANMSKPILMEVSI